MKIEVNEIKEIIMATGTNADIESLGENESLEEAGVDSLEVFNVLLGIEEKYEIKIPDEDIDNLGTISQIINYIESNK